MSTTRHASEAKPPLLEPAPKRHCPEMHYRRMLALLVETCNEVNMGLQDPKKHVLVRFDTGPNEQPSRPPLRPCAICAPHINKALVASVTRCGKCHKHLCGECERGHSCQSPGPLHSASDTSAGGSPEIVSDSDSDCPSSEGCRVRNTPPSVAHMLAPRMKNTWATRQ
jgi:hypothetical protein